MTGILTLRVNAPGRTTLERLQWLLDQLNRGDIIDNVTVSGAELHDVTLHNEQGEDFLPAWTFTEIKYDVNNDGKRIVTTCTACGQPIFAFQSYELDDQGAHHADRCP